MNAEEYACVSLALQEMLAGSTLLVERPEQEGGNLVRWEEVPAEAILARWMQNGWKVSIWLPEPDPAQRRFELVTDDPEPVEHP